MIIEGLVTTVDEDSSLRVSPMGPTVTETFDRLTLHPYQTSRTFTNLKRTGQGVFHVTDDVELIARAAVGVFDSAPNVEPAGAVDGFILSDTCRWYAFRSTATEEQRPRAVVPCTVVAAGRKRDFLGFNRAKNAVLEAAILATRVNLLARQQLEEEMQRLEPLVNKTGGPKERKAFNLLQEYIVAAKN